MKLSKEILEEKINFYQSQLEALPPKPWNVNKKSYELREKEMLRKIHCYSKALIKNKD
jgi:hypothetical protein